jgi:hypothetical protein
MNKYKVVIQNLKTDFFRSRILELNEEQYLSFISRLNKPEGSYMLVKIEEVM